MKQRKAFSVLMLCMGLSLILSACGRNKNTEESIYQADEGMPIAVEEDTSRQPDTVLCVEKSAEDTIIVSFENGKLSSVKDGSEILIRFYYDETRSGGYELSSSTAFWALSRIGEGGPNLVEGTDFTNTGAKWSWEVLSPVFYDGVENVRYFEAIYRDWNNADASGMIADGTISVETGIAEREEADPGTQAISAQLDKLLFMDEYDREYMTPDTDDFRILIYDIPEICVLYSYGIKYDDMGYPEAYILNPGGDEKNAACKYIEVKSYDKESGNSIVRQKLVFETEEDALHPYVATYPEFWYYFEDYSGAYGVIPDDFSEDSAIRTICDEIIPDTEHTGENTKTVRKGNIWYKVRYDDGPYIPLAEFAGLFLYDNTSKYAARNTDNEGLSRFKDVYQHLKEGQVSGDKDLSVTVFYSKLEEHGKRNIKKLSLEDVEDMLNNPDDKTMFMPATSDYVYVITLLSDEETRIVLASFDENEKLIQYIERDERTDDYGYGNYIVSDHEKLSSDQKVLYSDLYDFYLKEGDRSFTDKDRKKFIEEWEMEYEYDFDSYIQIIESR